MLYDAPNRNRTPTHGSLGRESARERNRERERERERERGVDRSVSIPAKDRISQTQVRSKSYMVSAMRSLRVLRRLGALDSSVSRIPCATTWPRGTYHRGQKDTTDFHTTACGWVNGHKECIPHGGYKFNDRDSRIAGHAYTSPTSGYLVRLHEALPQPLDAR